MEKNFYTWKIQWNVYLGESQLHLRFGTAMACEAEKKWGEYKDCVTKTKPKDAKKAVS